MAKPKRCSRARKRRRPRITSRVDSDEVQRLRESGGLSRCAECGRQDAERRVAWRGMEPNLATATIRLPSMAVIPGTEISSIRSYTFFWNKKMNAHPSEHIVKSFDTELARLTGEIVRMGEISITQLEAAMDVLERRDSRAAERVIINDDAIDELESVVGQ